ncbi:MAG: hypothetical protein ACE5GM_07945 [bacterium]
MKICFYISGHGFGHTTRSLQVVKTLLEIDPHLRAHIKTGAPKWFVEHNFSSERVTYHSQQNDVGIVQSDSLHFDPHDTLKACERFWKDKREIIQRETAWAVREKIDLILADIPFTAFEISAKAGIPGVGITNFSWDWIYEPFLEDYPQYRYLVEDIKEAYRLSDLLYRLPLYGDLSAFPRIRDVPLIARKSEKDKQETRRILGLPLNKKLILCSFGGIGIKREISFNRRDFGLVSTLESLPQTADTWRISTEKMRENSLHYQDLVAASDAVLTKLGYGIVSEAIANRTSLLYIDSSDFREYPLLERGVSRLVPALPVSREELYQGGWEEKAGQLLQTDLSRDLPLIDGAERIARDLVKRFL